MSSVVLHDLQPSRDYACHRAAAMARHLHSMCQPSFGLRRSHIRGKLAMNGSLCCVTQTVERSRCGAASWRQTRIAARTKWRPRSSAPAWRGCAAVQPPAPPRLAPPLGRTPLEVAHCCLIM